MKVLTFFKNMKTWHKFAILLVILAVCTVGVGLSFVHGMLGKVQKTDKVVDLNEISCVDVDGYVNIALLGVDSRNMKKASLKGKNTDCIIVMSINTDSGEVNMLSVYRDTYTRINGTSTYSKINSAYALGGAKGAMKTLNETMDLNISNYVLFNFKMVADLVNEVGGIEVDVEEYEIEELNKYTRETARIVKQKKYKTVKKPGRQTLEGVQAVSYGRIRKGVGDDFKRTDRMRLVIELVSKKLKEMGMAETLRIAGELLPQIETNLSENDMIGLAQRLKNLDVNKSVGFPYEKTTGYLDGLSYVFPVDLVANVTRLHEEFFGQEGYEPTETVHSISAQIQGGVSGSQSSPPSGAEDEWASNKKHPAKDAGGSSSSGGASSGTESQDNSSSGAGSTDDSSSGGTPSSDGSSDDSSSPDASTDGTSTDDTSTDAGSGGETPDTGSGGDSAGGDTGGESAPAPAPEPTPAPAPSSEPSTDSGSDNSATEGE